MSEKNSEAHDSLGTPEVTVDVSKRLLEFAITSLVKTKERGSSFVEGRRANLQERITTTKEAGSIVYDMGASAVGTVTAAAQKAIEKLTGRDNPEPGDHHQ